MYFKTHVILKFITMVRGHLMILIKSSVHFRHSVSLNAATCLSMRLLTFFALRVRGTNGLFTHNFNLRIMIKVT